jgi:NTP pyrophosphatase (non-canonical NTP hydrolase)
MTLDEYQTQSRKTALYPKDDKNFSVPLTYPALGLVGEAGEVAEKVKKIYRDDKGQVTDEKKQEIKKELGDVLWYTTQLATELGFSLEEVAQANLDKLFSRLDRGVLGGSGDNR